MSSAAPARTRRFGATMREGERVMPLELFFDLVFVLALTQCTALMAKDPTWEGMAQAMLDPRAHVVGMGRLRVAHQRGQSRGGDGAHRNHGGDGGHARGGAHRARGVRHLRRALRRSVCGGPSGAHRALRRGEPGEPAFRHSVLAGIGGSTVLSVGLLVVASFTDGAWQFALFGTALLLDLLGPYFFGSEGWKLAPGHFAERHGLIIIIALGESIVAIGVGAEVGLDTGEVVAAVLGVGVAAALWWLYFDVVALVAERRLINAAEGRERNEIARDSYSYLHLPMVAGIVLLALGLKKTLGDVDHALKIEPAFALLGGTAIYLFAHVAFRWRNVHTFSRQRFACGLVLLALIPAGVELPSLATLAILFALLVILIVYETRRFAERRDQIRHQLSEATP